MFKFEFKMALILTYVLCALIVDDLNLAYHSVLPLEVHGANYCNMRLLTKALTAPQMVSYTRHIYSTWFHLLQIEIW